MVVPGRENHLFPQGDDGHFGKSLFSIIIFNRKIIIFSTTTVLLEVNAILDLARSADDQGVDARHGYDMGMTWVWDICDMATTYHLFGENTTYFESIVMIPENWFLGLGS